MNNITASILSLVLTLFVLQTNGIAEELTLKQAISIGLKNNYDILIQRNNKKKSDNNRLMGTGYLLPQVSVSSAVSYSNTDDLIDAPASLPGMPSGDFTGDSRSANVSFSWTVFDGFRMFYARSMVYKQAKQGEITERIKIEKTVSNIINAYYGLVNAKKTLDVKKELVHMSEQRFEKTKLKSDLGMLKKRELLGAQTALNMDLASLLDAKINFRKAMLNLNKLLGREIEQQIDVIDSIVVPVNDRTLDDYKKLVQVNNRELRNMELSIKLAKNNLGLKRSAFFPMLMVTGGYGYNNAISSYNTGDKESEMLNGNVGINLKFNVLNGFSVKTGYSNAKLDLKNSILTKQNMENQINALAVELWTSYKSHLQKIEFDRKSLESSRLNLQVSTELFNMGKISDTQFREAQLTYSNMLIKLNLDKYQACVSLMELQRLAGVMQID